ncbi:MAG: DUF4150 domain-containing protein [Myxococcales bacterium]|jgi:hypothetical protein|nr:DUF4150 domain-containing protein [Myxococcales bacterium]
MFGNSQMGGVNIGFPDICKTPPMIPIPYPNISFGPTGFPPAFKIFWMCTPSHNIMTMPMFSVGDTPGLLLGLISQTVMAPTRHIIGAFTMLLMGLPATRMTTVNIQNLLNSPGMTVVPSQFKVIILKP